MYGRNMISYIRLRHFSLRFVALCSFSLAISAIAPWVLGQDAARPLVVRAVPIESGNRISSFGGEPERFAKTPVARAAQRARVAIAPPAHQALAHGYNDSRLFYLFYNDVANVPPNRYLVQRIQRTKKTLGVDGEVLAEETHFQVEAFKSLNGRIKRPDQHFGSYGLGNAHRRMITKEYEVGLADVAHLGKDAQKQADGTTPDEPANATTKWPFENRLLFQLIQPYSKEKQVFENVDYTSSVKWKLEVWFDRLGNYGIACPELGIDVTHRVPDLAASSADWAPALSTGEAPAVSTGEAPVATGELTLQEGEGIEGLQIGVSSLRDAVRKLGNPISQKRLNGSRNVVFKQKLSLNFTQSGRLHTVSTLSGFTGQTTRGIRHGDGPELVVSRYGPPVRQTQQTITYPDIIFWKDSNGKIAKMVAWQRPNPLKWSRLPDHPNPFGVAGPVVGVHEDVLITAGGANFPDGLPWHPTKDGAVSHKKYWSDIHVMTGDRGDWQSGDWQSGGQLAAPVGYSVSVSTPHGVLALGGERSKVEHDGTRSVVRLDAVMRLAWNANSKAVEVSSVWPSSGREIPTLPSGTTAACGTVVGDYIYLAGGDTGEGGSSQFLRLSITPQEGAPWKWEALPTWPGPPRTHAIGVAHGGKFYLISGRNKLVDRDFVILNDAYVFDPGQHEKDQSGWKRIADVSVDGKPTSVMAGTGITSADGVLTVIGGATGEVLLKKEVELPRQIAAAKTASDDDLAAKLAGQATDLYDFHKGFSRNLLTYNPKTNIWSKRGEMPVTGPVTTTAVLWKDAIVIPSGERSPGVRTRSVWKLD
jgi:N-acetylneuraminic acid mutarotase